MTSSVAEIPTPPPAPSSPQGSAASGRRRRLGAGNSLAAKGEPMVWLTGGALALAVAMIVCLLVYVFCQGIVTFWPVPLTHAKMGDGTVLMGEQTRAEWYRLDDTAIKQLPPEVQLAAQAAKKAGEGLVHRRLLRTGNFDLTGTHFHWINDFAIETETTPRNAMVVERLEKGRFYGTPKSITIAGKNLVTANGSEDNAALDEIWQAFVEHHDTVVARRDEIEHLEKHVLGIESARETNARLEMRGEEIVHGLESEEYVKAEAHFQQVRAEVEKRTVEVRQAAEKLKAQNRGFLVTMTTAQGVEKNIDLADIVRMYPANNLSLTEKWSLYFSRWWEFFFADPREANSEGGVWPAIIGTLTMTLAMALAVVPFGVLAALYLREYAKSGPITSAVRIAINNLAGVPSIVFGVFGLGFFCYVMGASIDELFYPANLADNNPVYGKGAVIWASLTLALLTVPVVIVAAEEALAAVPNSMREGSYACGGSKWQTIRRIVLPHAMPGIMTGTILAMARGAGEVAPLMLVGAVKLAPELPFSMGDWSGSLGPIPTGPIHFDRSFMHLGFHIYDLGFQSQNSEAAKPMVFTTTLLLIAMVAGLNLMAIWLRARLRKRFVSGGF